MVQAPELNWQEVEMGLVPNLVVVEPVSEFHLYREMQWAHPPGAASYVLQSVIHP